MANNHISLKTLTVLGKGALSVVSPEFTLIWDNGERVLKDRRPKCFTELYRRKTPCPNCPIPEFLKTREPLSAKVRPNSTAPTLQVSAFPIDHSFDIFVQHVDLTRVSREIMLQEWIFENLPDGILLTDQDLKIQIASPGFFTLFPFIKSPVQGKDLRVLCSRASPPFPKEWLDSLFALPYQTEESRIEFNLSHPIGKHVEALCLPIEGGAASPNRGFLIRFYDQTEKALHQAIQRQREEWADIHRLFLQLYGTLNPSLEKIKSLGSQLAGEGSDPSPPPSPIQEILLETDKLCHQLQTLKNFIGKEAATRVNTNLHHTIRKVLEMLHPVLNANKITVKLHFTRHLKPFPASSEGAFQALKALCLNAVEALIPKLASPDPNSDFSPLIKIKTKMQNSDIELTLSDNGVGMTPTQISQAFRPGFTTKDPRRHGGLGLYLSRAFFSSLGGSLNLTSVPNVGTKVVIHIPSMPPIHRGKKKSGTQKEGKNRLSSKEIRKRELFKGQSVWISCEKDARIEFIQKFLEKNGAIVRFVPGPNLLMKYLIKGEPSLPSALRGLERRCLPSRG